MYKTYLIGTPSVYTSTILLRLTQLDYNLLYPVQVPMALKSINLRIPEDLLKRIDESAAATHMDRSNWIRFQLGAACGVSPSRDAEIADDIKVVDERARVVLKDLMNRINKLEAHCFGADPFSD